MSARQEAIASIVADDVRPFAAGEFDGPDVSSRILVDVGSGRIIVPLDVWSRIVVSLREKILVRSAFERTGADFLASAVCQLIDADVLDARSVAGDALLDYAGIRHGQADPIGDVRREGARLWAQRRTTRSGLADPNGEKNG